MSDIRLEARSLGKVYRSRLSGRGVTALSSVTFDVRPGEILAFLGPNGAGKTTTINLVMGFLRPTSGEARVFGQSPDDAKARARIGYLPEHYAFYPFLSAPALLHYFGRLHGIATPERTARVHDLLERLGIAEAGSRAVGKYSRGMRQRLGIAQALINRPDLLVLDEPTSGFDPVGRRMVRDLMLDLKRAGTSIFLSSHILSEVESICDRVIIINRGSVIRQGPLDEIVGAENGFEVTFRDSGDAAGAALRAAGFAPAPAGDERRVQVVAETDAQRAIDVVRAAGGVVTGYRATSRSLEDVFIEGVSNAGSPGKETP